MKPNLFLKFYGLLDSDEKRRFEQFLHSPYYNNSKPVRDLFALVRSHDVEGIDKKTLWKQLYPQKPFADNHLRKLFSDLNKLAQQFAVTEELGNSPRWFGWMTLRAFSQPRFGDFFRRFTKRFRKSLGKNQVELFHPESYFLSYQLESEVYVQGIRQRKNSGQLQSALSHLDTYYVLSKLKYLCEVQAQQLVLQSDISFILEEEVLELAAVEPFKKVPLVGIYRGIFEGFKSLNQLGENGEGAWEKLAEHYKALNLTLQEKLDTIDREELIAIQNFQQNFCIRMIGYGDKSFNHFLNQLFESRIKSGTIFFDGMIIPEDYKNRVSLLLLSGREEEARLFTNEFKDAVDPAQRASAFHYNLGHCEYYSKNFDAMREQLQMVDRDDPFYTLDSKSLMIKAFFEEFDIRSLESHLESLKKYLLRNHRFSEERLERHRNRYRYFEKLFRVMAAGTASPERLQRLQQDIQDKAPVADRTFLLEMLDKIAIRNA